MVTEDSGRMTEEAKPKRKRRRWPLFLLSLLVAGGLFYALSPRELSLTDPRLPRIKALGKDASSTFSWSDSGELSWFGDRTIWRFDRTLKSHRNVGGTYGNMGGMIGYDATILASVGMTGVPLAQLSPDGKWLLHREQMADDSERPWRVRSLLNRQVLAWPPPPRMPDYCWSAYWMQDSLRWIMLYEGTDHQNHLAVGDVRRPGVYQHHLLKGTSSQYFLGSVAPDEIILLDTANIDDPEYTLLVYAISPRPLLVKRIRIRKAISPLSDDAAFCPRTKQIAWIIKRDAPTTLWSKIRSLLLRRSAATSEELWVSELDGTRWRKIGNLENTNVNRIIEGVEWLPDGRRLSVLIGDTIYIVPAD